MADSWYKIGVKVPAFRRIALTICRCNVAQIGAQVKSRPQSRMIRLYMNHNQFSSTGERSSIRISISIVNNLVQLFPCYYSPAELLDFTSHLHIRLLKRLDAIRLLSYDASKVLKYLQS